MAVYRGISKKKPLFEHTTFPILVRISPKKTIVNKEQTSYTYIHKETIL